MEGAAVYGAAVYVAAVYVAAVYVAAVYVAAVYVATVDEEGRRVLLCQGPMCVCSPTKYPDRRSMHRTVPCP